MFCGLLSFRAKTNERLISAKDLLPFLAADVLFEFEPKVDHVAMEFIDPLHVIIPDRIDIGVSNAMIFELIAHLFSVVINHLVPAIRSLFHRFQNAQCLTALIVLGHHVFDAILNLADITEQLSRTAATEK
jgi:hypothetical protein